MGRGRGDGKRFRNGVDLEPHLLVGRRVCTTVWRGQDGPADLVPGSWQNLGGGIWRAARRGGLA